MEAGTTTVQITMPAMGESVTEGTILEWLKQVGDEVEADEGIVEVSTDKVDAEVPVSGQRDPHEDPGGARRDRAGRDRARGDLTRTANGAHRATAAAGTRRRADESAVEEAEYGADAEETLRRKEDSPEPEPEQDGEAEPPRSTSSTCRCPRWASPSPRARCSTGS